MTNKFTCIIVDDEYKAIELLKDSLKYLYPNIEITGTYTNWVAALEALRSHHCDIFFTDISMPGKNGMELLRLVPEIESEIIFITAHSDYALNAFKFSAAGYILKPIDDAELRLAVDKAIERIRYKKIATKSSASSYPVNPKIGIPNNKGIDYIDVNEIIYFETVNKYTKVVTKSYELLSSYNLGRFKELVEDKLFYQIHRSYIVNLNCVKRYESPGIVVMSNNKEIPVSKAIKEDFLKIFTTVTRPLEEE